MVVIGLHTSPLHSKALYNHWISCVAKEEVHNSFGTFKITVIVLNADQTQVEYLEK